MHAIHAVGATFSTYIVCRLGAGPAGFHVAGEFGLCLALALLDYGNIVS